MELSENRINATDIFRLFRIMKLKVNKSLCTDTGDIFTQFNYYHLSEYFEHGLHKQIQELAYNKLVEIVKTCEEKKLDCKEDILISENPMMLLSVLWIVGEILTEASYIASGELLKNIALTMNFQASEYALIEFHNNGDVEFSMKT